MLSSPLTSVLYDGNALILTKVREGNFSSEYMGTVAVTNERAKLEVKHTIPGRGQSGESHLLKLSIEHVDVDGNYHSTTQAHEVIKTLDSVQNYDRSLETHNTLISILGNNSIVVDALNRES